jgi:hypothetical protein
MLGAILAACFPGVPPYAFSLGGVDGQIFTDSGTFGVDPTASVSVSFFDDGNYSVIHAIQSFLDSGGAFVSGANAALSAFQMMVTHDSGPGNGALGAGSFGAWQPLAGGVALTSATAGGTFIDTYTVYFRFGGKVLAQASFTLGVSLEP